MVEEKKWMKLNYITFQYEPLSEEEEELLLDLFVKHLGKRDIAKEISDLLGAAESGLISKEEVVN